MDIVSGPFIYFGPDFLTSREIYPAEADNASTQYSMNDWVEHAYDSCLNLLQRCCDLPPGACFGSSPRPSSESYPLLGELAGPGQPDSGRYFAAD
jgi:hypothetical protein